MLNLTAIKTPGVYIDEVPKFPPSIAAVETAIPAFIGYTEKADKLAPQDLNLVPTRIGSIADYELYFGGGAKPTVNKINIDLNYKFLNAEISNQKYLYDALRLFYANGGGDCYIVSIGKHSDAPDKQDFLDGIAKLEKYDEPTILLFPDASLTGDGLYEIQIAALAQCELLKDRVGLFDLKQTDYNGDDFRSKIGINNLKYGAAYTPWIKVALQKNISYADIAPNVYKAGTHVTSLKDLTPTTDTVIKGVIDDLEAIKTDTAKITADTNTLTTNTDLLTAFNKKRDAVLSAKTNASLQDLFAYIFSIAKTLNGFAGFTNTELKNSAKSTISSLVGAYTLLVNYDKEAVDKLTTAPAYATQKPTGASVNAAEWGTTFTAAPVATNVITGGTPDAKVLSLIPYLESVFTAVSAAYQSGIIDAAATLAGTKHDALMAGFPVYKAIVSGINDTATAIPPSGAMAGIYAAVDNNRGVWKAPANVSIGGADPDHIYSSSELERLNVDVVSGKSINAIRAFTGKGTLVFGARTLAGNDNEWRYISVRRFFNMVEESTRNATMQFVFEPNDANTWVRVQAMIENFLTTLWRQGALQGSTPEKAFYVAVGLGKTMTSLDILEGRMIIEIGMAVVRPAEFIILRFSHKMAEA